MLARAALRRSCRRLPAVAGSLRPAACHALLRHGAAPLSSTPSESALRDILERVAAGELGAAEAVEVVQQASAYEEIDQFAKIDHQRTKRTGARHARIRSHRPRGLRARSGRSAGRLPDVTQPLPARAGLPEVVFGQNKTTPHIVRIMEVLARETDVAMVTRVEPDVYEALCDAGLSHLTHYPTARIVALSSKEGPPRPEAQLPGRVVVRHQNPPL